MRKPILSFLLAVLLPSIAVAEDDAKTLLQQALFAEEAEQDLEKASASYEQLIEQYDSQRDYVIASLYRLAEVRRKQDRNEDAAKLFRRILEEFPEADPHARLSRENLIAMGLAPAAKAEPSDPDEEKELRRLTMLAENSPERVWNDQPLNRAATEDWTKVIKWLADQAKENGADVQEKLDRALAAAAKNGNAASCATLLALGADIGLASEQLPLAIMNNLSVTADWLVSNGADLNVTTWLSIPPMSPRKGVPGAETNAKGFLTPLSAAIVADDKYWIDRLLKLEIDVNAVPELEERSTISPLALAAWKGHAPLVRRLLEAGADPDFGDRHFYYGSRIRQPQFRGVNWSPLHYGAGDHEIVEALLGSGAKVEGDAPDDLEPLERELQITPLHCACAIGNPKSVRLLLGAGADPNSFGWFQDPSSTARRKLLPGLHGDPQFTPLMLASLVSNHKKAIDIMDQLLAAGADPFAKNPSGFDVFEVCRVIENGRYLTEKFLYPKIAAEQAINVTHPESQFVFELAISGDENSEPPKFQDLLSGWSGEVPIRGSNYAGVNWALPILRRIDESGELTSTSIPILDTDSYPELHWGDIIEFPGAPFEESHHRSGASMPDSLLTLPFNFASGSTMMPDYVRATLAGLESKTITIKLGEEEPREYRINSGITYASPFGEYPDTHYARLIAMLVGEGLNWSRATLLREGKSYDLSSNPQMRPTDGDSLHYPTPTTSEQRRSYVQLLEPETGIGLNRIYFNANKGIPSNLKNLSPLPTLFQFIATAYQGASLSEGIYRASLPAEQRSALKGLWLADEEEPAPDLAGDALTALTRDFSERRIILPHPDFSSIKIRRVSFDGTERVIECNLLELIAAAGDDPKPEVCRAGDISLEPGDIVELRAHRDRLDQPWNGFAPEVAKFLEKALRYSVTVKLESGDDSVSEIYWAAPTFFNTDAGLIPVKDPQASLSLMTSAIDGQRSPEKPSAYGDWWLRAGAVVVHPSSTKPRTTPARPRVVPNRSNGRRVVLPPKTR